MKDDLKASIKESNIRYLTGLYYMKGILLQIGIIC